MKRRYQKHTKPELPSRQKLASELAEQKQRAEQATQLAHNTAHSADILRGRAFRAEDENQRLVKQIEGLSSFKEYVRVAPSPNFAKSDGFLRTQQIGMPRYHVGIDFGVDTFQRHDRGNREILIEAIADQIAREARAAVIKNLQVI